MRLAIRRLSWVCVCAMCIFTTAYTTTIPLNMVVEFPLKTFSTHSFLFSTCELRAQRLQYFICEAGHIRSSNGIIFYIYRRTKPLPPQDNLQTLRGTEMLQLSVFVFTLLVQDKVVSSKQFIWYHGIRIIITIYRENKE